MRHRLILIMLLFMMLSLCSCANNNETAEHEGDYNSDVIPVREGDADEPRGNERAEQAADISDEADVTAGIDEDTDLDMESESDSWKDAYSELVSDLLEGRCTFLSIDDENETALSAGWMPSYTLYDINGDDIPELFLDIDSWGGQTICSFDADAGKAVIALENVGYDTSGWVPVRAISGSECFVTGPAFSDSYMLYSIKNGKAEKIAETVMLSEQCCFDGDDNEISSEEFERLFSEHTGISSVDPSSPDLGIGDLLSTDITKTEFTPLEQFTE